MQSVRELTEKLRRRITLPPPAQRRALRLAAGASLRDVASVVGSSAQAVYLWETGDREPSDAFLERYADVLHAFDELTSELREPDLGRTPGSRDDTSDDER